MAGAAPATSAAAPAGPAAAPDGLLGIRLLEAPVDRRDDPRARTYIVDHVAPGTTITRAVEVSRREATAPGPVPVQLYPAPAEIRDGSFVFGPQGARSDLTGWTRLSTRAVTLDPGGAERLEVTITVPRTAAAGERYGVIWAQAASAGAGNVRRVDRVGIRVYLDVGRGGEAPSDFAIGTVRASRDAAGVPVLTAEVRNTGARAVDLGGSVALAAGPGGVRAGPFPVQAGTTLGAGQRGSVRAALDPALPDGPWTATLTLASGTVRHAVTVRLSFRGAPATPVTTAGGGTLRPVLLAAAAAVLALLVAALAVRSRRRRLPA